MSIIRVMFYFIYGNDREAGRKKAHELVALMHTKRPHAEVFRFSSEDFSLSKLGELVGEQGLFDKKHITFVDGVFEDTEIKEGIIEKLDEIKASENAFVFLEGKMTKEGLKKIEKRAEKVFEFTDVKLNKKENGYGNDFKVFDMADAFGRRDKKTLWVLFVESRKREIALEEIHGIIFWQVKSMLLAGVTKDATEAGLNPFVFSKARGFLKNYTKDELEKISSSLVAMYHESHRGQRDFASAFEQFILEL